MKQVFYQQSKRWPASAAGIGLQMCDVNVWGIGTTVVVPYPCPYPLVVIQLDFWVHRDSGTSLVAINSSSSPPYFPGSDDISRGKLHAAIIDHAFESPPKRAFTTSCGVITPVVSAIPLSPFQEMRWQRERSVLVKKDEKKINRSGGPTSIRISFQSKHYSSADSRLYMGNQK